MHAEGDIMASFESNIMYFILQRLNMKRSIDRYFEQGKFDQKSAKPSKKIRSLVNVDQSEVSGQTVYTMTPKSSKSDLHVLYLHGGAYIFGIQNYHFNLVLRLIQATGCTVTVPDYPLAPQNTYMDAYDMVTPMAKDIVGRVGSDNFILMGDSSGGGLALGLAQHMRELNIPLPKDIILLSPWLDVTMENPLILDIDKSDPILGINGLKLAGKAYAGNQDTKHPMVSPIYGNLENLANITLFISSNDLLYADAKKFESIMNEKGLALRFVEFEGLFHDWMLFNIKETKEVMDTIKEIMVKGK
jgi:acetyl esterase/lipase